MSKQFESPLKCHIGVFVFVGWTLSSFLCHQCGKIFMDSLVQTAGGVNVGLYQFIAALILTIVQCLTCILTFNIRTGTEKSYTLILLGSHTLATMAANYSMAYTEASSTQAIKLTEPVVMCIADVLVFKRRPSIQVKISIPIIITGSLMFCGLSTANNSAFAGIGLAFFSNVVLAARNVTLKKVQVPASEGSAVSLRQSKAKYVWSIFQLIVMAVCYNIQQKTSIDLTYLCGLLFASGLFHIVYSFISTNIVLKVMDVVSHSVANIFKRLLVVMMLYWMGKRQATQWNFVGLCFAVIGLFLYVQDKNQTATQESGVTLIDKRKNYKTIIGTVVVLASIVCANSLLYKYSNDITVLSYIKRDSVYNNLDITPQSKINEEFASFSTRNYFESPYQTNTVSETLTKTPQVIEENQRILLNLLSNIIGKAPYVMLMDIPRHKNKGDSAITAGELMIIKKLRKKIVFHCETGKCGNQTYFERAVLTSEMYPISDLAILLHGGGNLVGYGAFDRLRNKILNTFPHHKIILLSQSIWLHDNYTSHLEFCRKVYSNRTNLSIFLRDKQSVALAEQNFHNVKMYLAPDMAFGIGYVPRMLLPLYDIIWLRRRDVESSKYDIPPLPSGVSIHVSDWINEWSSNYGTNDLENAFNIAHAGFSFLQRGRIVITDRLHGHILSVLMDIPHVLIDNPPFYKLSSFDQTWTASLENKVLVSNGTAAIEQALLLLAKFNHTLPEIGPIDMHVNELNSTHLITFK